MKLARVRRALSIWLVLSAAVPLSATAGDEDETARVVVVANEREPESVELARYYMAARNIPPENLIALPMSSAEAINWDEFISQIFDPLRARLSSAGWLEGIMGERRDEFGRRKFVCTENRISYLVLCRGVPLKIEQNPEWLAAAAKTIREPGTVSNSASVDSELSTMAMGGTSLNGQIPNPLFRLEAGRRIVPAPVVRVVDLIDRQLGERDRLAGEIFNVGGGLGGSASLAEFTELCAALTGTRLTIEAREPTRPGDVPIYISDNRKVEARFGWSPRRPVRDVAADLFQWMQAQADVLRATFG